MELSCVVLNICLFLGHFTQVSGQGACYSAPCHNGGMCTEGPWGYSCACLSGYAGQKCEIDVDECASMPCKNGGTCLDGVNGFSCLCAPFYSGTNCESECVGVPCPSNVKVVEFLVSPDGEDNTDCLEYSTSNVSCKTITFIIQNRCGLNTHLNIQLDGQSNQNYSEPCLERVLGDNTTDQYNITKTYPCLVSLSGTESGTTLPTLTFRKNDTRLNTYQVCEKVFNVSQCQNSTTNTTTNLTTNATATNTTTNVPEACFIEVCQNYTEPVCTSILSYFLTHDCPTPNCSSDKLQFSNIHVKGFNIQYKGGHKISANNVHFQDFYIYADAGKLKPCYFDCENCNISYSSEFSDITLATDSDFMFKFENCTNLFFDLVNSSLHSTKIYASFLYSGKVSVNDSTMTHHGQLVANSGSQVVFQQRQNTLKGAQATYFTIQDLTVEANDIKVNETDYNAAIGIYLDNAMNPVSVLSMRNCTSKQSSSLLDYAVLVGNPESVYSLEIGNHRVQLHNLNIENNKGFSDILRIRNLVVGSIQIDSCTFSGNSMKDSISEGYELDVSKKRIFRTAVISVVLRKGEVKINESEFKQNSGSLGGALHVETTEFLDSHLTIHKSTFYQNSVSDEKLQFAGFGGAIYVQSNALDIFLKNCTCDENTASDSGGAIYVQSVSGTYAESNEPGLPGPASVLNPTSTISPSLEPASNSGSADTNITNTNNGSCPGNLDDWEIVCLKGFKGSTGNPGHSGYTGPPGPAGSAGPRGLQGPPGLQGATGATGFVGSAPPGARRRRSLNDLPIGPSVPQGSELPRFRKKRDISLEFTQCPNEIDKYACKRCVRGPMGLSGIMGQTGGRGGPGVSGRSGAAGPPGPRGEVGAPGARGPPGEYISTRRKRQATAKITSNSDCPRGDVGDKGSVGLPGSPGQPGFPGPSGEPGPPGARGEIGAQGVKGEPGNINNIVTSNVTTTVVPPPTTPPTPTATIGTPTKPHKINLIIQNSLFQNNKAGVHGGAMLLTRVSDYLHFNMTQVRFQNNIAGVAGGALMIIGKGNTTAVWVECDFISNKIQNVGKAKFFLGGSVLFSNQSIETFWLQKSSIIGNQLDGIFAYGSTMQIEAPFVKSMTIEKSVISDNTVYRVGCGFLEVRTQNSQSGYRTVVVRILDSTIHNNTGSSESGALSVVVRGYTFQPGKLMLLIKKSQVSNNKCNDRCHSAAVRFMQYTDMFDRNTENSFEFIDSNFTENVGSSSGAIVLGLNHANSRIVVRNCTFFDNLAERNGAAFHLELQAHFFSLTPITTSSVILDITDVDFIQNRLKSDGNSDQAGSAVYVNSYSSSVEAFKIILKVKSARFLNNTSEGNGGAIAYSCSRPDISIQIIDCTFENNRAGRIKQGGAVYIFFSGISSDTKSDQIIPPTILIENSSFTENIAGQGGSVFQSSSAGIPGTLTLKNSKFKCCHDSNNRNYAQNGSLLFASLSTSLDNVAFDEILSVENSICSVAGLVLGETGDPHRLDDMEYNCYNSRTHLQMETTVTSDTNSTDNTNNTNNINNTETDVDTLQIAPLDSLLLFCTRCTFMPYSSGNGSVRIRNSSRERGRSCKNDDDTVCSAYGYDIDTISPCYPCPFGGDCTKGGVKARPNYWGYKYKRFTQFETCPLGYCCNDIEIPCKSYNTCATHRQGRMCGECEPGFTESLMSRTCIPNDKCKDWWIWPAGLCLALSYLLWYMYKGDLLPGLEFLMIKVYSYRAASNNVIHVRSSENDDSDSYYPAKPLKEIQSVKERRIDPGYFDIIVYFVNIISLLKVKVEFQSSNIGDGFLYNLEKYITRYLDVDMQQVANVTVCPFPGINAVTKTLARPVFVIMILTIWLALYSTTYMLMAIFRKRKQALANKFKYFKSKLIEGYVETMKYSYSGLAGVTFIYLTTVEIGEQMYWKYNAEIQFPSDWQYGVIAFATIYTVPFSLTTILGGKLLQNGRIGYVQFMFACFLPLPYLAYWLVNLAVNRKSIGKRTLSLKSLAKSTRNLMVGHVNHTDMEKNEKISENAQVILDTYQGPYKDENSSWEGVIEFRKLLFNAYYLINNNIYRLVLCTITAVITLVHHNLVKPFKNQNSNVTETLSLALLCVACVTNSIKTVFTESGILVQSNSPTEQLLYLLNRLDRILILILVAYIGISELYYAVKNYQTKKKQ